jgi:hypothetical protein
MPVYKIFIKLKDRTLNFMLIEIKFNLNSKTTKRNCLDPHNVPMLVYVRDNTKELQLKRLVIEDSNEEEEEKELKLNHEYNIKTEAKLQ